MPTKLKVLQVIPKLGNGGAETGCFDLAHYLYETNCSSYIVTSVGILMIILVIFLTSSPNFENTDRLKKILDFFEKKT